MEQKHIALYLGSLQRGGAEHVMVTLAEYLFTHGWRVTLVTTYYGREEYAVPHGKWRHLTEEEAKAQPDIAVPVMYPNEELTYMDARAEKSEEPGIARVFSGLLPKDQTPARTINVTKRSNLLHGIWQELQPDIILSFLGKNNVMALLTTIGLDIPVVVSVRGNPSQEYASNQLRFSMLSTYPRSAGVVLQMKGAMGFFPENIREKATILPNPLSERFLLPRYEGMREKTIVSVGNLDKNKNHAMLLKAFARLKPSHPDYRLIIYGEGPERKHLVSMTHALGLRGSVEMPGNVNNLEERLLKAGAFVLCSNEEGMPNALMEAMSLGLPCISTDAPCGGPKELIREGISGLLTPVGDIARLEKTLLRIIDNPGFSKSLGTRAAEIQSTHHPDVVCAGWEEYLRAVAEGRQDEAGKETIADTIREQMERLSSKLEKGGVGLKR